VRQWLVAAALDRHESCADGGTYLCAEGPRFETPAEIRMFRLLGADLVGMTSVPEVVLAREAGVCYATVAVVTNWAAGIAKEPIKHGEVGDFMDRQMPRVRALFAKVIADHREGDCSCRGPRGH
jgi:5'-methylthioadenosine phosphorylase